ncbi:MAG: CoB--CoM heterodisulfide reductase iron-sulfur subunit A family protein [Bacteroidales bacterium]|nr:CoB--CoM heterodisulfide reductase iron-sulfur subunit A family protein [Bacteroidales bacterium]MBR7175787.1 CoB--CoM heterodisulfide reductase iron-sulfur subunit A family protein [Bacteroidales bacterium]
MKEHIVLIIGAGPAGLETAYQLKNLGLTPVVIERNDKIGGHLAQWDRLFPSSEEAEQLLERLKGQTKDIEIRLNSRITNIEREGDSFHVTLSNNRTYDADAIVLCTGFDLFKAEKKQEYGYGIYNNVITNAELERYFKTHHDERINEPKRIGFVHCVGSRDVKVNNTYCSKVCCATALKQACEIKDEFPDADVYCFYMDLRMFGKGYEDLYLKAQKDFDIKCVRGRVCEVSENIEGKLVIKAEDTLLGTPMKMTLDLLVLMCGMEKADGVDKIQKMLSLNSNSDGFIENKDTFTGMNLTRERGVFVAGACTSPKTLPDTLAEARAAAMEVYRYLNS